RRAPGAGRVDRLGSPGSPGSPGGGIIDPVAGGLDRFRPQTGRIGVEPEHELRPSLPNPVREPLAEASGSSRDVGRVRAGALSGHPADALPLR
ncbi:MAG TPA: hypothetical protein VII87_00695, partial [Solirubrobacteraceae bacterium]